MSIGFPLRMQPDADGALKFPSLETSVRESIEVIVRTSPQEQLMRPHFGAGLINFRHEPNTIALRRQIHDTIQRSLKSWEPRIVVERLDVTAVPDDPGLLEIQLNYRLSRTGVTQRFVMSLETGGQ